MWIRSQSKNFLTSVDNGFICINSNRIYLNKLESDDDCVGIELGKYSTEEKALKVLDMIQECIVENKANWLHSQYLEVLKEPKKSFIFQMPHDDEV